MNPTPVSDKSILVVGLVRNCGKNLSAEVELLRSAFAVFGSVSWLVIESDSTDDTPAVLEQIEARVPGFRSISLGALRNDLPLRTQRIARCRNEYMAQIDNSPAYAGVDYVAMADLDGVNTQLTAEALLSCWSRTDWDVCAANQRGPYYDIWALRHPDWCPTDCWRQLEFLHSMGVPQRKAFFAAVQSRMITLPEDGAWLEVDSAFGGLAIYRRSALQGLRYVGLDVADREICEHVFFHRQIRESGHRIFVNPKLINAGYTDQTSRLLLRERIKKSLWRAGSSVVQAIVGPRGTQMLRDRRARRGR